MQPVASQEMSGSVRLGELGMFSVSHINRVKLGCLGAGVCPVPAVTAPPQPRGAAPPSFALTAVLADEEQELLRVCTPILQFGLGEHRWGCGGARGPPRCRHCPQHPDRDSSALVATAAVLASVCLSVCRLPVPAAGNVAHCYSGFVKDVEKGCKAQRR